MLKGLSDNWISATVSAADSPSAISYLIPPAIMFQLTPNLLVEKETDNRRTADS
jgi:hypothetical protein